MELSRAEKIDEWFDNNPNEKRYVESNHRGHALYCEDIYGDYYEFQYDIKGNVIFNYDYSNYYEYVEFINIIIKESPIDNLTREEKIKIHFNKTDKSYIESELGYTNYEQYYDGDWYEVKLTNSSNLIFEYICFKKEDDISFTNIIITK